MKNEQFAVIGAGSGGLALAGHLGLQGAEVHLYDRSPARLKPIREHGGIRVSGAISGLAKLTSLSSDLEAVVRSADILCVVVPANAHEDVARACALYLRDGHTVVLMPGRTGGALTFRRALDEAGVTDAVQLAETQTILHTCRAGEQEGCVYVYAVKQSVPYAALPSADSESVGAMLRKWFPEFEEAPSVLYTSLGNVGAVLHPTPTLLNCGWLESPRTEYLHYYEGITPSIAALLEKIDEERLAVASAFGVKVPSVMVWLKMTYGVLGDSLHESVQGNRAYANIYAPKTLRHRYIYEDVPTGLVPMALLGRSRGVATPCMNMIIELASTLCGVDFVATGRNAELFSLVTEKDIPTLTATTQ
jgi:opine dehydrogenase